VLLVEDIDPETLRREPKVQKLIPPLHGALLKERARCMHLFEVWLFLTRQRRVEPLLTFAYLVSGHQRKGERSACGIIHLFVVFRGRQFALGQASQHDQITVREVKNLTAVAKKEHFSNGQKKIFDHFKHDHYFNRLNSAAA